MTRALTASERTFPGTNSWQNCEPWQVQVIPRITRNHTLFDIVAEPKGN
jgi:hypothetical protein